MIYLPQYSELYVISDLHMGGSRHEGANFQIFDRGERLKGLIAHIAQIGGQRTEEDVALVINGDVFDSLAEDTVAGYAALTEAEAREMMSHLFTDPSFSPVWEGLEDFLAEPKHHLILVVGNHDIELALPIVQDEIRQRLTKGHKPSEARLHFAAHGGGFACRVGPARVFCTHGNELDEWNWVDYNQLGQLANAIAAGREIDASEWNPNAGTRLVIDVMNAVKRRYPFVDVLKPEIAAVTGVIMALDKTAFRNVDLTSAFPVLRDKIRGSFITRDILGPGDVGMAGVPLDLVAEEAASQLMGPELGGAVDELRTRARNASEDDLLKAAERGLARGESVAEGAAEEVGAEETLGVWDVVSGWVGLLSKPEALRRALKDWLAGDTTFKVSEKDHLFRAMEPRVSSRVDFVVTGHTHKPRALKRETGGYYFNSGTWIRTLRLTDQLLDDPDLFENQVWPLLERGTLDDLDAAQIAAPGGNSIPLLFDRTNVVRISVAQNTATGELLRVTDDPEGHVNLDPEPGAETFRVR